MGASEQGWSVSRGAYHEIPTPAGKGAVVGRPEVVAARPELAPDWEAVNQLFPVQITRSFWDRIDLADDEDPLAKQVFPDARELDADEADLGDPVGDAARSPLPWVVHKYPSRVLLLITKRCHLYCRYCFRREHKPGDALDPSPAEWAAALEYALHSGAEEVILSGGDPLAVRDELLFAAIDALRPKIPVIRIHTRAPITAPQRVTEALVAGLRARAPVWVVVHSNHPRELAPDVELALARLVDAGVPVLNQAVLLRGVNDDPAVLAELFSQLVRHRVFPYYLHQTDLARGNAHLRVPVEEGRRIYAALRSLVSGVALPRYVVDPADGSGKRDVSL